MKILGTSPDTIDLAEDRDRFRHVITKLGIHQPESGMAANLEEAIAVANRIGYPVMVRPSYVLGGRAMMIVQDEAMLRRYMAAAVGVSPERPILIDKFLENAVEAEADALCDGTDAFVPAVMEHIEYAGIHSGDSACVIPPVDLPRSTSRPWSDVTRQLALELGVVGLINIQYAVADDTVYILEANPRASRTVPLVSKVCNIPMATHRHAPRSGREAGRHEPEARHLQPLRREGGGVPLQHVPGGRSGSRPRDALHG